ncbi:hypothetical protein AAFO92_18925 [Roseovarius sp. CAU 1744]|uniref:hypothetical protein n=1 Tax=Roseovarius sp. CAU 1744 TaxID=3140368 RepID=UPI00325C0F80
MLDDFQMKNMRISMPHRHTVRFQENGNILDYEVELIVGGVILYRDNPKVISGNLVDFDRETKAVEVWLRRKFRRVVLG